MTNRVVVPCLIVLAILSLGIIFCVWRRSKTGDGRIGIFQIIRVKKNNKEEEVSSDEEKESAAAGS